MEPKQCHECERKIYYDGLCYNCKERKKREKFQAMSETEVAAVIDAIIAQMAYVNDWDQQLRRGATPKEYKEFEANFFGLLAYHDISTAKIAEAALREGVYYPFELYRDAGPEVRKQLISLLKKPDCADGNEILCCLANASGDDVLAIFKELDTHSLPWWNASYRPIADYPRTGGWAINPQGDRVELICRECWPVFQVAADAKTDMTVSVATLREDRCSRCDSLLIDLLTVDGADERLAFLRIPGKIRIPVCPMCVGYCEPYLIRYTPNGDSTIELGKPFLDSEKIPDGDYAEMTSRCFQLAKKPESVFFANGSDESIITIGGFTRWIQGFQYDTCPDCGKMMRYIASVPWDAWCEWAEGTLYIEICTDCQVISVFHQQT